MNGYNFAANQPNGTGGGCGAVLNVGKMPSSTSDSNSYETTINVVTLQRCGEQRDFSCMKWATNTKKLRPLGEQFDYFLLVAL